MEALDDPAPVPRAARDGVTYAEKIDREDRRLDPQRPADALERRVRALTPHVGAYVELDDEERLGVRRAAPSARTATEVPPGSVEVDGERLLLGTAAGALELLEVQPAGGRPMAAADFLRGQPGAAFAPEFTARRLR